MMSATDDTPLGRVEETPDPIRYYRPVAIRSVVAAHKMIPRCPAAPAGTHVRRGRDAAGQLPYDPGGLK
ncbi:hypothetical protein LJR030_002333 [Rhizobium sp. LjRoot30]|uniref:hypothetical protein n=1 Tax=Rhizobium sp. LjRoot30 TaxID=3342320 RepID=UPI003ED05711